MNRLDVLIDARQQAEELGAVTDGTNYFEDKDGNAINPFALIGGAVKAGDVCKVCIAGAGVLASVLNGDRGINSHPAMWAESAHEAARTVLGDDYDVGALTDRITERGTPYVLAVLDRMIAEQAAAVTTDPAHTHLVA